MGTLRLKPKDNGLSEQRYEDLLEALKEALKLMKKNRVFYDLAPEEGSHQTRKDFLYIAKKEQLPIYARKIRNTNSLEFFYQQETVVSYVRLSPEAYRTRIVSVLEDSGRPMQKSEIIERGGLKEATWNLRVKELVDRGIVLRQGERRHAVYMLSNFC